MVERHHLVREVADDDRRTAGPIVIGGIDAHAGARHAGLAERDAGRRCDILESAVAKVPIQLVRLRVVRDEQIDPSVVVEVEHRNAESLRRRILQPGAARDVFEGAVAAVAIQDGALPVVGFRRAVRLRLPVERAEEVLLDRPFDVARDEQIQLSVVVVVEPERARGESACRDARRARHVDELAGTRISKQSIAAESRHVEIGAAVVVVVGGGSAQRVQLDAESRRRRHVGERAVAVVAIERETRFWACVPRPVRRVEEQDVLPAVAVGIEEQAAGPEGFGQVFAAERAVVVDESEAGRSGDVGERDRRRIPGDRAAGDGRGNDEEYGDERTSHGIRIRLCSPAADAWAPETVEPCAPSDVRESTGARCCRPVIAAGTIR